jgi:hypothetical protein
MVSTKNRTLDPQNRVVSVRFFVDTAWEGRVPILRETWRSHPAGIRRAPCWGLGWGENAKNITAPWHLELFRESDPGGQGSFRANTVGPVHAASAETVGAVESRGSRSWRPSRDRKERRISAAGVDLGGPVSRGRRRGPRHRRVTIRRFVSAFLDWSRVVHVSRDIGIRMLTWRREESYAITEEE